jgi:hypothetical protein
MYIKAEYCPIISIKQKTQQYTMEEEQYFSVRHYTYTAGTINARQ